MESKELPVSIHSSHRASYDKDQVTAQTARIHFMLRYWRNSSGRVHLNVALFHVLDEDVLSILFSSSDHIAAALFIYISAASSVNA